MLDTEQGKSLEEILERRRFAIEIVLIPIGLALLINLFTTFLISGLTPGNPNASESLSWAWMMGFLTISCVVVVVFWLGTRGRVEKDGFTVLFPLWIDRQKKQSGIQGCSDYDPAIEGERLFTFAGKDFNRNFATQCPLGNFLQDPSFTRGHFCWDGIMELMEAMLLMALKNFSERTTGYAPFFHGWSRRLADLLKLEKNTTASIPLFLTNNSFLKARHIFQIKAPFKLSLTQRRCSHLHDIRPDRHDMAVKVHRSFLTFSISPHWSLLANRKYRAKLEKQFKFPNGVEVFWLVIPVEMCLEFNPTFFSRKKLLARNYLWLQKAMQQIKLHMSLGFFLEKVEDINRIDA
ncbi:MAG: hypothetical protein Q7U02_06735 [Desulfosalsimonadaceae bacterium]|nr:hypothetical protein [Desulfosalsimonadaceae bacterium]